MSVINRTSTWHRNIRKRASNRGSIRSRKEKKVKVKEEKKKEMEEKEEQNRQIRRSPDEGIYGGSKSYICLQTRSGIAAAGHKHRIHQTLSS